MTPAHLQSEQFATQLLRIEGQIQQRQLQQAALELNNLSKSNAKDPRPYLLGSRLAEASGHFEGMLVSANKAHELAPNWPVATIHLAAVLARNGFGDQAVLAADDAIRQATEQFTLTTELLFKAATIARRQHDYTRALRWLHLANQNNADDFAVQHQIAEIHRHCGQYDQSIDILSALLERAPEHPVLLLTRLQTKLEAGRADQALVDARALVALEPNNAIYLYYLDIASGKTPETQPVALTAATFDDYADNFDIHVVRVLKYRLPRDIAQDILHWHPDRKCDVLDLGCGTGLLGACLGTLDGVLVGIDLSAEMLAQAKRHNVYHALRKVNLINALHGTPGNQYHVIAALDVLIYVGKLDQIIPDVLHILLPGGHFVFSCESCVAEGTDYLLQSNFLYAHNRTYVQRLLMDAGFQDILVQDRIIRYQGGVAVDGYLVTAIKPAIASAQLG